MNKRERQQLVEECRNSGMTAKAWCEAKGIEYRQYVAWATKLNREKQHEPQQWADVTMPKEERATGEIRLNCGNWTICVGSGFSPALLADVLRYYPGMRQYPKIQLHPSIISGATWQIRWIQ